MDTDNMIFVPNSFITRYPKVQLSIIIVIYICAQLQLFL